MTAPPLFAIKAQADLHHAWFLGLQLMVSSRKSPDVMEDWMFRLFRRQHLEKFLGSFDKLGLTGLPDAVACAKYHVLSNVIGGVPVDYMQESETKAWLRFRYPRWMCDGPVLCGLPASVGRGFMRGWYAHNGISLGNPRLGFVCVSEDVTGEFGFCGYFKEYDHDLADNERLQFAKGDLPPPYDPAMQPRPPANNWPAERLEKAARNYAMDYIRNGLAELATVIGATEALEIGGLSARLIGLQYYPKMAGIIGAKDGDVVDARAFLMTMMAGMGDKTHALEGATSTRADFEQTGLRILRDLEDTDRNLVLDCWAELWQGCVKSHSNLLTLDMQQPSYDRLHWSVQDLRSL